MYKFAILATPRQDVCFRHGIKREDLQSDNEIGTESSLKNGFQAGASREAPSPSNGSESTPMVKPTSDNKPVPRGGTIEYAIDRRRKEKGLPPFPRIPDRSGQVEKG